MVSHPRRGGRRPRVSRWLSAPLALCKRVLLGVRDQPTSEHSGDRPGHRLRQAKWSGAFDGPLIAAVFVVGVAVALVMTLF